MKKNVIELRVGICDCSSSFLGKFRGSKITAREKNFQIREVKINNSQTCSCLKDARCHFSLDVHLLDDYIRLNTMLNTNRVEENDPDKYRIQLFGKQSWNWVGFQPARIKRILGAITEIISSMDEKQFVLWTTHM
jgi:hypothetical protein